MSEVNYRRNGMKYSTSGKCWGVPNTKRKNTEEQTEKNEKPKSSRERRAMKKNK